MSYVKPKKSLGQHFLRDENIAARIVAALGDAAEAATVLEIGPGMGVLSKYLLQQFDQKLHVIEYDQESVAYLQEHYPALQGRIWHEDFLEFDFRKLQSPVALIGNFPYNISSQIVFRIIEQRQIIPCMTGMFQKEVAERLAASPRSKAYGILSVLSQAYYQVKYLFTVNEGVFNPPPKVKSAVISFVRHPKPFLNCNEILFLRVVKAAFNQRRKTLRNALHSFSPDSNEALQQSGFLKQRAEELSVDEFVQLTRLLQKEPDENK